VGLCRVDVIAVCRKVVGLRLWYSPKCTDKVRWHYMSIGASMLRGKSSGDVISIGGCSQMS
jgi:hypothetical protein